MKKLIINFLFLFLVLPILVNSYVYNQDIKILLNETGCDVQYFSNGNLTVKTSQELDVDLPEEIISDKTDCSVSLITDNNVNIEVESYDFIGWNSDGSGYDVDANISSINFETQADSGGGAQEWVALVIEFNDTIVTNANTDLRSFVAIEKGAGSRTNAYVYLVENGAERYNSSISYYDQDIGNVFEEKNNTGADIEFTKIVFASKMADVSVNYYHIEITNVTIGTNSLPSFNVTNYSNPIYLNSTTGYVDWSFDLDVYDREGDTIYYGIVGYEQSQLEVDFDRNYEEGTLGNYDNDEYLFSIICDFVDPNSYWNVWVGCTPFEYYGINFAPEDMTEIDTTCVHPMTFGEIHDQTYWAEDLLRDELGVVRPFNLTIVFDDTNFSNNYVWYMMEHKADLCKDWVNIYDEKPFDDTDAYTLSYIIGLDTDSDFTTRTSHSDAFDKVNAINFTRGSGNMSIWHNGIEVYNGTEKYVRVDIQKVDKNTDQYFLRIKKLNSSFANEILYENSWTEGAGGSPYFSIKGNSGRAWYDEIRVLKNVINITFDTTYTNYQRFTDLGYQYVYFYVTDEYHLNELYADDVVVVDVQYRTLGITSADDVELIDIGKGFFGGFIRDIGVKDILQSVFWLGFIVVFVWGFIVSRNFQMTWVFISGLFLILALIFELTIVTIGGMSVLFVLGLLPMLRGILV